MDAKAHADDLMRRLLTEAGLDFDRPEPRVAWECFKRFVRLPIPGVSTLTVGFECSQADDRDDVLWLAFVRRFEEPAGHGCGGIGWSCGCLFRLTATPPPMLGANDAHWWWAEHGTIEAWAEEVERRPTFARCPALDGWAWEGFSE
jgi:hypothetical protein